MKLPDKKILVTGGNGTLGRHIVPLLKKEEAVVMHPSSREWDITEDKFPNRLQVPHKPDIIIHAAAYTNVPAAEVDRYECVKTNVYGTETVSKLAKECKAKLVYISSDYANVHEKGFYAWSKLAGESFVGKSGMIIRTSFKERGTWGEGKLEKVFHPVHTNADWVDIIAQKIVEAICLELKGIVNIGTKAKLLKDLAVQDYPDVIEFPVEKADKLLGYHYPRDCRMELTI